MEKGSDQRGSGSSEGIIGEFYSGSVELLVFGMIIRKGVWTNSAYNSSGYEANVTSVTSARWFAESRARQATVPPLPYKLQLDVDNTTWEGIQ